MHWLPATIMKFKCAAIAIFLLFNSAWLNAQGLTGVMADIHEMSKEAEPWKAIALKHEILKKYAIDSAKDLSTMDLLHQNIALAFAGKRNYKAFERYCDLIKNKFEQTNVLSIAVYKLVSQNTDVDYACEIAKDIMKKYYAYKDDPAARPAEYAKEQWDRWMDMAQYVYADTYASALFAAHRYEEALKYQRMAVKEEPEQESPETIERYAKLLELNGETARAKELLLKVAGRGKLTLGITAQLKQMYVLERGTSDKFDNYLDSLQSDSRRKMLEELKTKKLNQPAPAFTLKDVNGNPVSLSDYKGKIVVLDLWATWCAPCIASFPAMQEVVKKYPDVVFLFIAVSEGKNARDKVTKFLAKNKYPFHVLIDEPVAEGSEVYKVTSAYKPDGIPAKYFIDKAGLLQFRSFGFESEAAIVNEIDTIVRILNDGSH
jgi:thiol-disulfide isomerase/thioredoxin